MAKATAAQEPTMDEILASIRRMISDEEQHAHPGPHAVSQNRPAKVTKLFADDAEPAPFEAGQGAEDNVIELAIARAMEDARIEVAAESAAEAAGAGEPAEAAEAESMLAPAANVPPEPLMPEQTESSAPVAAETRASAMVSAPAVPAAPAPAAMPPAPEAVRLHEEATQPLMSPQADAAVAGAFNRLAVSMLSRSSRTIDELVEDMLRPLLRGWLDNNLPPLVERLVREEIERVSRGRR